MVAISLRDIGFKWILLIYFISVVAIKMSYGASSIHPHVGKVTVSPAPVKVYVKVNLTSSVHNLSDNFLSVCTEVDAVWRFCDPAWTARLKTLALALGPSDFRLGGTSSHFMTFYPNESTCYFPVRPGDMTLHLIAGTWREINITVTGRVWEPFNSFLDQVGWNLLLNVNLFKFRGNTTVWDTSNTEELLTLSSAKGIRLPYFQLGNEPNAYPGNYNFSVSPSSLVENFRILRELLSRFPLYKNSQIVGPDVAIVDLRRGPRDYLQGFLAAGATNSINGLSLHHYYCKGSTATPDMFLNVSVMDSLKTVYQMTHNITDSFSPDLPVLLTETSTCFGGGAPNISNRFMAGFLWLDKLGVSALNRASRVFRQALFSAQYSLISIDARSVNPDFYLSVLFKRLVRGPIFSTTLQPLHSNLRVYANCASNHSYSPGAVVFYYLNVDSNAMIFSLSQYKNFDLDLYILTSGDDNDLLSKNVKLNGKILQMSQSELPLLSPVSHRGDVILPRYSLGFIVAPQASSMTCRQFYTSYKSGVSRLKTPIITFSIYFMISLVNEFVTLSSI